MPTRGRPAGRGTRQEYGELVVRRAGESFWRENFSAGGRRFRASLGTDSQAEAEIAVLGRRAAALGQALLEERAASPEVKAAIRAKSNLADLSVGGAEARYLIEVGQYASTADDIRRMAQIIVAGLGEATRLRDLTFGTLSSFVASRRVREVRNPRTGKKEPALRANGSINREIGHLRTVILAAKRWGARIPDIEWSKLLLDEPDNVQTVLSADQEAAFLAELRPDYHPMVLFSMWTGVRLENTIGLRWRQIDWQAKTVTFRTKSRKPGGKLHVVPLTDRLAGLLARERGHDFEVVFTYEANRSRHDPHTGMVQKKGERYPFTQNGWRKEWDRARRAVGLPALRFHDLRHTAATRALAATGNLKTVQRMLGHSDIATTLRYLATDTADVRRAMEAVERAFALPRVITSGGSADAE
jgi:integrase